MRSSGDYLFWLILSQKATFLLTRSSKIILARNSYQLQTHGLQAAHLSAVVVPATSQSLVQNGVPKPVVTGASVIAVTVVPLSSGVVSLL